MKLLKTQESRVQNTEHTTEDSIRLSQHIQDHEYNYFCLLVNEMIE